MACQNRRIALLVYHIYVSENDALFFEFPGLFFDKQSIVLKKHRKDVYLVNSPVIRTNEKSGELETSSNSKNAISFLNFGLRICECCNIFQ
jgi:hypothetical protein